MKTIEITLVVRLELPDEATVNHERFGAAGTIEIGGTEYQLQGVIEEKMGDGYRDLSWTETVDAGITYEIISRTSREVKEIAYSGKDL